MLSLQACAPSTPKNFFPAPSSRSQTESSSSASPIVPVPSFQERTSGKSLRISGPLGIRLSPVESPELKSLVAQAQLWLSRIPALQQPLSQDRAGPRSWLSLELRRSSPPQKSDRTPEGYRLSVDERGIALSAESSAGLFYGLQSLRQLLLSATLHSAPHEKGAVLLPYLSVEDTPRFAYRGLHLDVSRHFFSVSVIKRLLDLMAFYKLNFFHWHLTDDQGWRIEIEKYPRLTQIGATRSSDRGDSNPGSSSRSGKSHEGFYSQTEIRELVRYAAARHITVVPEIEMPGHSRAALAAYPELACEPGPYEVATTWGIFEEVLCPTEYTIRFMENVLREVIELFPGPYVHLGGDEVPKKVWRRSPLAQKIMKREGIRHEAGLQGYFLGKMRDFLQARGKTLIAWDEITEGGAPKDAVVMSWRGTKPGQQAAQAGHRVIMAPWDSLYFNFSQESNGENKGVLPPILLQDVYAFEPVPAGLSSAQADRILGAQGCLWTERIQSPERLFYMLLPRLLALSEVLWSSTTTREWNAFVGRLAQHALILDSWQLPYRLPDVFGLEQNRISIEPQRSIALSTGHAAAVIHYTLDGSTPSRTSPRYDRALRLALSEQGTVVSARAYLPDGRKSALQRARFRQRSLQPAPDLNPAELSPGLRVDYVEGKFRSVRDLERAPVLHTQIVSKIEMPPSVPEQNFGLEFWGWIEIPEDGIYNFELNSDDGSDLRIGDVLLIDHDGRHAPSSKRSSEALEAGLHPIRLRFFQGVGGKSLSLKIRRDRNGTRVHPRWFHPH